MLQVEMSEEENQEQSQGEHNHACSEVLQTWSEDKILVHVGSLKEPSFYKWILSEIFLPWNIIYVFVNRNWIHNLVNSQSNINSWFMNKVPEHALPNNT